MVVLNIDTTFKLCDMWVTDTSYRNHSVWSKKHAVAMRPVMFYFTKDEATFRRFCSEIVCANPRLLELKKIGCDMEAAILNGFKSIIASLLCMSS